jgi:hypothetical protein
MERISQLMQIKMKLHLLYSYAGINYIITNSLQYGNIRQDFYKNIPTFSIMPAHFDSVIAPKIIHGFKDNRK